MGESLSPGTSELAPCLSPVLAPLPGLSVCVPGAGVPPPPPPGGHVPPCPHIPPHPCTPPRPCMGAVRGRAVLGGVGRGSMMEDKKELEFFHSK